eukprot:7829931-Pyramimonas_sp.AAC.1
MSGRVSPLGWCVHPCPNDWHRRTRKNKPSKSILCSEPGAQSGEMCRGGRDSANGSNWVQLGPELQREGGAVVG